MDVLFVPPDLRRLDELRCEAAWLSFFSDERPLRGALGLLDWRMRGYLARQIVRGRICGKWGDVLLLPGDPLLPFEKLFIAGLGRREDFTPERYSEAVASMLDTLGSVGVRSAVCALPGRSQIDPPDAMLRLLAHTRGKHLQELILIEDTQSQKQMEPVIAGERRRERAE